MGLQFEQVSYAYPLCQEPTLQNLSFVIPQGQNTAIMGRNGCGKTTLLRLAQALYRPQSGQIFWCNSPFHYQPKSLRNLRQTIGLVFQDPEQQLVGGTVAEDLSYGLYNLGLPTALIAEKVKATLQYFDLIDFADAPVHYLSLGQKKRLAIADVMILEPQLLLLDEPTAFLDPQQIQNLAQLLLTIQAKGTTVVMATHDLEFVYRWADRIILLDQGQFRGEGSPLEIFKPEQKSYLAQWGLGLPTAIEILDLSLFLDPETCPDFRNQQEFYQHHLWQQLRYQLPKNSV
jgi:cobalt/nickel transport system ATP-binding protein